MFDSAEDKVKKAARDKARRAAKKVPGAPVRGITDTEMATVDIKTNVPEAPPAIVKHETREAWLHAAVDWFRPLFKSEGNPLPDKIQVSVGMFGNAGKAIGQCWAQEAAADQLRHLFVSPALDDVQGKGGVLATLLHECVHAALPFYNEKGKRVGHTARFAHLAADVGLVKPWTATTASDDTLRLFADIVEDIGAYPHGRLDGKLMGSKPQTNRHLKCECPDCGGIARVTATYLKTVGAPFCACGGSDALVRMSNPLTGGDDPDDDMGIER